MLNVGSRCKGYTWLMRRVFALVLVLALIGVGAYLGDQLVTERVERRLADEISVALAGDATVRLDGWPVSVQLLRGTVARADLSVTDADLPDAPARLRTLEATLYDVEVDLRGEPIVRSARDGRATAAFEDVDLPEARLRSLRVVLPSISGSLEGLEDPAVPLVIHAPGGRFEARLTDDDVAVMLGVPQLTVELLDGHVRLSVGPLAVDAAAEVDGGSILLRPRQPLLALALRNVGPLRVTPRLPPTAVLTDIELQQGAVRLFGSVDRLELPAAR
jgi:hypothetical protein